MIYKQGLFSLFSIFVSWNVNLNSLKGHVIYTTRKREFLIKLNNWKRFPNFSTMSQPKFRWKLFDICNHCEHRTHSWVIPTQPAAAANQTGQQMALIFDTVFKNNGANLTQKCFETTFLRVIKNTISLNIYSCCNLFIH